MSPLGKPSGDKASGRGDSPIRVAYIMSRFPKLTETFILDEILAMKTIGVEVTLYPLLRERTRVMHRDALPLVEEAMYLPFLTRAIVMSQISLLRRRTRAYVGALVAALRGTLGSANYFLGAIAIFPKVAHAARLMEEAGVTHVHCHFSNHPALAGFIIRRLTGIPYSFTAHGSDLHIDRHMLCQKLAESKFAMAISEHNRTVMIRECPDAAEKVMVLHCGVDTRFFQGRNGSRDATFTIVSIGKLHEVKGHRYLIDACAALAKADIEFRCQIIGDGPDRDRLEARIAGLGVGRLVTLLGERDRDEVRDILGSADVLVAPSVPTRRGQREGIPVVLMEAMSAGVAVVASRISGIPELVEDGINGILVPPRGSDALAAALLRLYRDPSERERLGAAGREKVLRSFDVLTNATELARSFARQEIS